MVLLDFCCRVMRDLFEVEHVFIQDAGLDKDRPCIKLLDSYLVIRYCPSCGSSVRIEFLVDELGSK